MNSNDQKIAFPGIYKKCALVLFAFVPVFVIAQTLLVWFYYETDMGHYARDAALASVLAVCVFVFCAAAFLIGVISGKRRLPGVCPQTTQSKLVSVLCGLFILMTQITRGISLIRFYASRVELIDPITRGVVMQTVLVFVGIPAAAYFIVGALSRSTRLRDILGLFTIAFFIIYLLALYYRQDMPINSPLRLLNQLSSVAAMMWFVYEMRVNLGQARSRLFVTFALIVSLLLGSYSVCCLVCVFLGRFEYVLSDVFSCWSMFFFTLYAVSRTFTLLWVKLDPPAQEEGDDTPPAEQEQP